MSEPKTVRAALDERIIELKKAVVKADKLAFRTLWVLRITKAFAWVLAFGCGVVALISHDTTTRTVTAIATMLLPSIALTVASLHNHLVLRANDFRKFTVLLRVIEQQVPLAKDDETLSALHKSLNEAMAEIEQTHDALHLSLLKSTGELEKELKRLSEGIHPIRTIPNQNL